jgi:hypothetical protein
MSRIGIKIHFVLIPKIIFSILPYILNSLYSNLGELIVISFPDENFQSSTFLLLPAFMVQGIFMFVLMVIKIQNSRR